MPITERDESLFKFAQSQQGIEKAAGSELVAYRLATELGVESAFIGAGGLGVPIVAGLQLADTARILSGALPAAALALIVDQGLAGVERLLRPRGMD